MRTQASKGRAPNAGAGRGRIIGGDIPHLMSPTSELRRDRPRRMPTPTNDLPLPPFTNQRAVCPSCGRVGPARVPFDRDCPRAAGDHYHRICWRCAHDWVESCVEATPVDA